MAYDDGPDGPPEWMKHCRAFIDSVGDQMLVIDRGYRLLLVNRAFIESTGLTESEIVGKRCHEVTHRSAEPCWVYGHACPLAAVLENGESVTVAHEHFAADGRIQQVDIVGSPARDGDGKIVGLIESIRDVTLQKELEAALRLRNAQLERARLKHQHFISAVCHELKNILNGVGLNAQLLKLDKQSEKTRRRGGVIVEEAKRLERLIEDMQDAAAIDTQRFSVHSQRCELLEIVRECVEARQLGSPEHQIRLTIETERIEGMWDAGRLRQVVDNLLSNAIKFSPEGGVVQVSVRREAESVRLAVEDFGIGIPEAKVTELFEPYARVHTGIPGAGLGLFLSRGIVEAHGGEIQVTSREGEGSVFEVRLPLEHETPALRAR